MMDPIQVEGVLRALVIRIEKLEQENQKLRDLLKLHDQRLIQHREWLHGITPKRTKP